MVSHAKIGIVLIVGVMALAATPAFAGKNFNSSKSNTSSVGKINEEVGNILLRYDTGGAEINQVTDALEQGASEDELKTLLIEIGVNENGTEEVFAAITELGAGADSPKFNITLDGDPIKESATGEAVSAPASEDTDEDDDLGRTAGHSIIDGAPPILINAVEVRGWDPKKKQEFLQTVKTHAEIKSGQDLENFARGVLLQDENIKKLEITPEGLNMKYRVSAKLFRLIPFYFNAKVESNIGGRVKVKFPWYRFLFSKSVSAADLEEASQKAVEGKTQASRMLEALSHTLKAKHAAVREEP